MELTPGGNLKTTPTTKLGEERFMEGLREIYYKRYYENPREHIYMEPQKLFETALFQQHPDNISEGMKYETLWLICLQIFNPSLNIEISNPEQDYNGIDFYINGLPMDVSTNFEMEKIFQNLCSPQSPPIIYIPPSIHFNRPFQQDYFLKNKNDSYFSQFIDGTIDTKSFISHTYKINRKLLNTLLRYCKNPEDNNNPLDKWRNPSSIHYESRKLLKFLKKKRIPYLEQRLRVIDEIFRQISLTSQTSSP